MAEHKATPLQLQWGRQPGGEFTIQMVATFPDDKGVLRTLQVRSWVLSKQEEDNLKRALAGGLVIASGLPPNGHQKV